MTPLTMTQPAVPHIGVDTDPPASLMEAYRHADTSLRVRQSKVCCVLSMLLVPACTGMDAFVYPDLIRPMFVVRIVCVLALLPVLMLLHTQFGRRNVWWLGHAPPGLPALAICWMIYVTEGTHSRLASCSNRAQRPCG